MVDAFLLRLAGGADPLIGAHIPPLIDASILARDALLGSPGGAALDMAIIIGVAVGGVVFLVLLVVAIVLLVRWLRERKQQQPYSRVGGSAAAAAAPFSYPVASTSAAQARYEPVNSRFYGASADREPLIQEPLLYLARNSRAAVERVQSYRGGGVGSLPLAVDIKHKPRAQVLFDFDGSTGPNCLSVFKGT